MAIHVITALLTLLLVPLVLASSPLSVSDTGSCGPGVTCQGSRWGNCCSTNFFCGSGPTYCGGGCKPEYGTCFTNMTNVSPASDGSCGSNSPHKYTCQGSALGNCCSASGFCGNTSTYCGQGCQSNFGTCYPASSSTSSAASSATHIDKAAASTAAAHVQIVNESSVGWSQLSTADKAGIIVGASIGALLLVGAVVFLLIRRTNRRRRNGLPGNGLPIGPHRPELYDEKDERHLIDSKTHLGGMGEVMGDEARFSKMRIHEAMTDDAAELPAYTKRIELPARALTPRDRMSREERVSAGYDGAYRGL